MGGVDGVVRHGCPWDGNACVECVELLIWARGAGEVGSTGGGWVCVCPVRYWRCIGSNYHPESKVSARLAWPLRKDDTHKSRKGSNIFFSFFPSGLRQHPPSPRVPLTLPHPHPPLPNPARNEPEWPAFWQKPAFGMGVGARHRAPPPPPPLPPGGNSLPLHSPPLPHQISMAPAQG